MSRKNFTKTSLVVLALLAVTACGGSKTNLEQRGDFAQKLDSELFLRADGQKENRREVEYWKGTQLLKRVTVFYSSGGKQISVYREDGTVRVLTEWYPDASLTVAPPAETLPSVATAAPQATLPADPNAPAASPLSSNPTAISNVPAAGTPAASPNGATAASGADTASGAAVVPPVPGAQTAEEALGTAYTSRVYDPPTKFGRVKRSIEYSADGKTVVKSSFFREDGSLAAYGKQVAPNTFELHEYLKDGQTLARQQQFTNEGDVVAMRVIVGDPSNTLTRKLKDNVEETTVFGDNHMRATRTFKQPNGQEEIEFYRADGRALKYIVYRQYKIEVLYFKEDGSVDHYRVFEYDGSMTVTKYRDGAGKTKPVPVDGKTPKEAYRQTWKVSGKDAAGKEIYYLANVEEIDATGRVARRLYFSDKGKLSRVDYLNADDKLEKVVVIGENGNIESFDTYVYPAGGGSPEIATTKVDKIERETINSTTTKPLGYEDVRPLVGAPVVPYYYYGDYGF
jgi:hypothetical protein